MEGRTIGISHMLQLLAMVVLAFSQSGQTQVEFSDCYEECRFEDALQPGASCKDVAFTIDCYENDLELCVGDDDFASYLIVADAIYTCTSIVPTGTPIVCPSPPLLTFDDPTVDLEEPDIYPDPNSCDAQEYFSTRQCSMFGYSHMRPFKEYNSGLQTCTVPGDWYLLKHPDFSVRVVSEAAPGCNHTMLTKVNVTFSTTQCSEGKSYIATANSTLPSTFTDGQVPVNINSGLQLKQSGSVVSILAVWINTTIVIRRYVDTLSVTIQVPGEVTLESEGLCYGCPAHAQFDVPREIENYRTTCPEQINNSTYNCFLHPLLSNTDLDSVESDSYDTYCIYDLMKSEQLETLTLLKAIGRDARMLPDVGIVPLRPSTPSEPPRLTTTGTVTEATTTTEAVKTDKDVFGSSSRVSPLNTLTISGLLLVCLVLALLR